MPNDPESRDEERFDADLRGLRRHTLLQHVIDRAAAAALSKERVHRLLDAVVSVASDLSLPDVLRRVVSSACDLAGARYGALGVLSEGEMVEFTFAGMDDETTKQMGGLPTGKGLIGEMVHRDEPLMLRDLREHEAFSGFPEDHPEMRSLLGVPVRVRDEVFGILYLTEKLDAEDFTESDRETVSALAAAAGLAIENARLFDQSHRREQWLRAINETTASLLTRTVDDETLHSLARGARLASHAAMALVAIHNEDDQMDVRAADGLLAEEMVGLALSVGSSLTGDVYTSGSARSVDNLAFDAIHRSAENARLMPPGVRDLGPAILVPMAAGQRSLGVLMLAKEQGVRPFDDLDMRMAEAFAGNAALAIEFTRAQEDRQRLALFEERDRIARDLHDLVIQRLFALGLGLHGLHRHKALASAADEVTGYVEQVDVTIREIRKSIFSLQEEPASAAHGLRADLLRGLQECTGALGFEPTVRLEGPLDTVVPDPVRPDLLATMREALSNVARHAKATSVLVTVVVSPAGGTLELEVDDNGRGLPDTVVRRSGLANMTRRAQRWSGSCEITSTASTGTTVRWMVPIQQDRKATAEAST
ncbi:GAF domain-containing protein [Labedaea rhizosphaerae]|uniref:Histidine kinase/DNA gyrase B/HSP90-like ATPase n=1 Tax=Labedaea rhizosphaerae TaxID=598644 RepID=A0A4R6RYD5_LABRH|nr:GAF domain-containing protein [Labedaea rhizosphaerae]TDP92159.1 histidine kinase/DNA gyrase B/HSP90-like ATPase [Labedaea rhizosphaerae]